MSTLALRAKLREKSGALPALKVKAFAAEATDGDKTELKALLAEIKQIESDLELAEEVEATEARSSKAAGAPVVSDEPSRVPATVKKVDPEQALSLAGAAALKAKHTGLNPMKILEDEGYGGFAQDIVRGQKAINTLVSSEGGVLVPAAQVGGGMIPFLRNQSTFLDAGPVRVNFTNGQFKQARGASGATASYVAQGGLKPVSTPTFDAIDMAAKKLAGIVPLTKEAMMWSVIDLDAYVRADLRQAIATVLDLNAWLGTGAGASPTGIFNKTGVQTYTPTFAAATTPTLAELDALATGMILKLTSVNLAANGRWRWVMSYRTFMRLADMRVGDNDGDLAYPGLQGAAPTWKGFPVVVTNQIPINGGGTTDETTLALVDFTHVLYGEEEGIVMRVSDQATLDIDGAGTLVHLYQQNMVAILAETMHDFGLRYAKAVVKATIRF